MRMHKRPVLMRYAVLPARKYNALWGEPERAMKSAVGFLELLKTVLFSLSFRRKRPFAQHEDSVIGEAIEVYANCDL